MLATHVKTDSVTGNGVTGNGVTGNGVTGNGVTEAGKHPRLLHVDDDFAAFVDLLVETNERLARRVVGECLMSNRFHLLLLPHRDGDPSRWMQWPVTSHARRNHRHYQSIGNVGQSRFKAFPALCEESGCVGRRGC